MVIRQWLGGQVGVDEMGGGEGSSNGYSVTMFLGRCSVQGAA